jgi:hypothetical protein
MQSNSEQEFSKPVMLCKCGKVLETPRDYAAHCKEFPDHFVNTSAPPPDKDAQGKSDREILAEVVESASVGADNIADAIRGECEVPGAAQITVKEALAAMARARPTAMAGRVDEETVEIAAEAFANREKMRGVQFSWKRMSEETKSIYRDTMRAALLAALQQGEE